MKLNLPSTWTKEKMPVLLLLTLLNTSPMRGGEQFKKCLDNDQTRPAGGNLTGLYDVINAFASKQSDQTNFCCDSSLKCDLMSSPTQCPNLVPPRIFTQCNSVNNAKFCIAYGSSSLPSGLCGGILGNANSTDATVGICPSPQAVRNTLNNQSTILNKFSWLCCDKGNCQVPTNVEIKDATNNSDTQAATANCATNQYSLMCFNDNSGWTCTGNTGSTINIWPNPIGSCLEQVSLNSVVSPSPMITPLSNAPDTPSLTEKIAIPVGTIAGTVLVGGITYYLIKKTKRNSALPRSTNIELAATNYEADAQEVVDAGETWLYTDEDILIKQNELEQLLKQTKRRIGANLEIALETLLDTQAEITKDNNTFAIRQLQREAKEKLQSKLSLAEIDNLCQKQTEIVQLQHLQEQEQKIAQIQVNTSN